MKAVQFNIPKLEGQLLKTQVNKARVFYDKYHYHEEFQLMYVLEGTGTEIVGDHISTFKPGDVTLIGPNLPHVFRSDEVYYSGKGECHALLLFFKTEPLTEILLTTELSPIARILSDASAGLKMKGPSTVQSGKLIRKLVEAKGVERLTLLLQVLNLFSKPGAFTKLSGQAYHRPQRKTDSNRLNNIFNYLLENYTQPITLDKIADVAHMSPTAFCRYFKQHTDKSFTQFLTELRISHACRLLTETKLSVAQVAYQVGYNNISHFNKQFKFVKQLTPSAFLKQH